MIGRFSAALAVVALVAVAAVTAASAHAEPMSARPAHFGAGVGGHLGFTGDAGLGSLAEAELYPGGRLGRLGFRVEARGLGEAIPDGVLAGVIFEGAASRPRLQIALYATAGAAFDGDALIAAGVQTQLWLLGPLALGLDGGGVLRASGSGADLILGAALSIRFAR